MAKAKSASNSQKQIFGKRKTGPGSGQKSYNKHTPRPKSYRGQGR
jgi:hypothetical protein